MHGAIGGEKAACDVLVAAVLSTLVGPDDYLKGLEVLEERDFVPGFVLVLGDESVEPVERLKDGVRVAHGVAFSALARAKTSFALKNANRMVRLLLRYQLSAGRASPVHGPALDLPRWPT